MHEVLYEHKSLTGEEGEGEIYFAEWILPVGKV